MATSEILFDKQEQLDKIKSGLLPEETVEAVFDMKGGGTGFVGITSKRLIVYDQAFLRKMKAVVSIPYSRVVTVAAKDDSGLLTGRGFFSSSTLVVTTPHQPYELEFRGADKAHTAHKMILTHIL
jgi:PH (Pleckstrin Homology) domain-containing protein